MNPKHLRLLIVGLALLILGPAIGWGLSVLGMFHTATNLPTFTSGTIPNLGAHMKETTSGIFANIIPLVIGAFSGALGLFLVLLSLILNFGKKSSRAG